MHREENPPFGADGDIADRFGIAQEFLECRFRQDGCGGNVLVRLATTVTYAQHQCRQQREDEQEDQEMPHAQILQPARLQPKRSECHEPRSCNDCDGQRAGIALHQGTGQPGIDACQ